MRKKVISVILAVFMIICQMWGMKIMTSAASDDVVSIGDVTVKSYAEIVQFLHNVADVTQSSTGQISIKLTKNIKGRIRFCIQDGNIVFDANGKTLYGSGTNEPICIENYYDTKFRLCGNGILVNGVNNAIFSGSGDYLDIESGVFIGRFYVYGGNFVAADGDTFSIYNINTTTDNQYTIKDAVVENRTEKCRIRDYYGNVCVIQGSSRANNNEAPKITGIENGGEYCLSVVFTVKDDDLQSVTDSIAGETKVLTSSTGMYTVGSGVHTITAKDSGGNKTVMKIYVKATHTRGPSATEDKPQLCLICNALLQQALGHKHSLHLTKVDKVESTCTTNGNVEYYVCECGKLFSDANAVTEITKADTEVELKAHVEGDWITDTEAGYDKAGAKHKECTVCGQVLVNEEIPAIQSLEKPASPQTGDNNNMVLYVSMLLLSAAGLLAVISKKRRVRLIK